LSIEITGGVMKEHRISYLELAILILLLGVFVFIDAPDFISASEEGKICELIDGLERMRPQLSLYQAEHNGKLPPCDSYESFRQAMTTDDGKHNRYVDVIPRNPFNDLRTVRFDGSPPGTGQAGWRLDTKTGRFQADNDPDYAKL